MIPKNLKSPAFFSLIFICQVFVGSAKAATELEPIIVRRLPYDNTTKGMVSAVITQEEMKRIPANAPEDFLTYLGVDVQTRGLYGVKSDISLNASTFQQVLILVNGMRVKDPQTSHHDLDLFFNIDDIERIEIIPAAATAVYGPDGIGGAVNFVLKKPTKEKNSLTLAAGNHDTFEEKLNFSYEAFKARNRLSVSNVESDGSRFDTDFRSNTFFHSTVFQKDSDSLFLNIGYNEKEFGAYDFYTPNRGYPSKEWTNTKFIDGQGVWDAGRLRLEPHLNFRQHHDKFMLDITNPSLYLNYHQTDVYELGNRLAVPFAQGEFGLGADYGEERITSNNLGKHIRSRWDVYLNPVFELSPRRTLNFVLRCDDYSTFGEELTGSVSLKHNLDDKSDVYAALGRTIRIPTFTELYYSDPTTAGDLNLKPEQAYHLEAGGNRQLREDLNFSFSFFVRQEYDTIDFTKLAPSDPKFIARNISEAFTCGLNTVLKWQATEKTFLDLRYFYADKRLNDDGKIYKYGLSFLKHMVNLGIDNELPFGHNRIDFIMKKKPIRRAWLLVNDRMTYSVNKNIELFFEVYNLGNVEYQEIEGVPEQGRLFKFGTKFTW